MRLCVLLLLGSLLSAATVRVGVFGLLHPRELRISGSRLKLQCGARSAVFDRALIEIKQNSVFCSAGAERWEAREARVAGTFTLEAAGAPARRFQGSLTVAKGDVVVEMDREIAVAAVVSAESAPGAGAEALKALAVAARSYYAARARHLPWFDFCDTTHCQHLREPTPASREAARTTRGMVLRLHGAPLTAMYSASCGRCFACRPGQKFYSSGKTTHGVGLCQKGAARMAREGADFRAILARYYPEAVLGRE